jgi:hypothetical protein
MFYLNWTGFSYLGDLTSAISIIVLVLKVQDVIEQPGDKELARSASKDDKENLLYFLLRCVPQAISKIHCGKADDYDRVEQLRLLLKDHEGDVPTVIFTVIYLFDSRL